MAESKIRKCPKCGQKLRIPTNVGGILMKCPSCGQKIHSDFKVTKSQRKPQQKQTNFFYELFELPSKILDKLIKIFSR